MKNIRICLIAIVVFSSIIAYSFDGSNPNSKFPNKENRKEEFMDWGLGMFVHWSMDAQLGSVISHSLVGASKEYTEKYFKELPKTFNPRNFNPDEWMEIAKISGVKYMVLTAKHHNGFCMWNTKTTDFNIMNTPYKKDIVKMYVNSCRKYGIKVGIYFSPEDFRVQYDNGFEPRRVGVDPKVRELEMENNKKQLNELFKKYGDIDVIFFDGVGAQDLGEYVHQLQPNCIVTRGEMTTPEQHLPKEPIPGPWESCFTLGNQWQYKPTNEVYKSGTTLINMLIETRAKGGNLLINVGPDPYGKIPFEQERRFRELGLWMFVNNEAMYDVRPCPVFGDKNTYYTKSKDGKSVYVMLTQFIDKNKIKKGDRNEVVLEELIATSDTKVSVLGQNSKTVEYVKGLDVSNKFEQTEQGLKVSYVRCQRLYNNKSWPNCVVLKIDNVKFKK